MKTFQNRSPLLLNTVTSQFSLERKNKGAPIISHRLHGSHALVRNISKISIYLSAMGCIVSATSTNAADGPSRMNDGLNAFDLQNYANAANRFEKVLSKTPLDSDAISNLLLAYKFQAKQLADNQKWEEASKVLRKSIALRQDSSTYAALGKVDLMLKDFQQVLKDEALAGDASDSNIRGFALIGLDKLADATKEFSKSSSTLSMLGMSIINARFHRYETSNAILAEIKKAGSSSQNNEPRIHQIAALFNFSLTPILLDKEYLHDICLNKLWASILSKPLEKSRVDVITKQKIINAEQLVSPVRFVYIYSTELTASEFKQPNCPSRVLYEKAMKLIATYKQYCAECQTYQRRKQLLESLQTQTSNRAGSTGSIREPTITVLEKIKLQELAESSQRGVLYSSRQCQALRKKLVDQTSQEDVTKIFGQDCGFN